jgi:hypothetical protein
MNIDVLLPKKGGGNIYFDLEGARTSGLVQITTTGNKTELSIVESEINKDDFQREPLKSQEADNHFKRLNLKKVDVLFVLKIFIGVRDVTD